jgi:hypothetical protein
MLTSDSPRDRMQPVTKLGRVAQWQSSGLLSHWLKVRVLPRSPDQTNPEPHTIAVEQLLKMFRFENRSKLAELHDELVNG